MIRILFICHGNICRSPMAEFVFRKMAADGGISDRVFAASAATSTEEIWNGIGEPVYPPAQAELERHRIPYDRGKRATLLRKKDYNEYDLLIGMDSRNMRGMHRICGGDPDGKMHLLMEYVPGARPGREVADPWYSGNFTAAWNDIESGCRGLLAYLEEQGMIWR